MFGSSIKKMFFAAAMTAGLTLTGCFFQQGPSNDNQSVVVGVHVAVPQMSTLAKAATIKLSGMTVILTSDVGDTIVDFIAPGSNGLVASVSTNQSVQKYYSVKPLRKWKLRAITSDSTNSHVIHDDSTALSAVLYVGDTVTLALNMNAKYEMYVANFNNLPDSISSGTNGTVKEKINFHELKVNIDSSITLDSIRTYFTGPLNRLTYDYVPVGSHRVILSAYGTFGSHTSPDLLLYNDTTTINVGPGVDTTVTRVLTYRGPGSGSDSTNRYGGTGRIIVNIGKVGTVTINSSANGLQIQ